jgi:transcriptional regulator GlxA family with amidase domain
MQNHVPAAPASVRPGAPHRIALVALPDFTALDLGIPTQVFRATDSSGVPLYEIVLCTPGGVPVRNSTAGFSVVPEYGLEALEAADTVIVPGIHGGPVLKEGVIDRELASALRGAAARSRMVSICTGAFALAAAGLLDGRPATTHWIYTAHFQSLFPRVRLDPDVLFIDDGNVLTSAGVASGIDLCLHILRRDHGSEIANKMARRCVTPPWREGGQAQYIERPLPDPSGTTTAPTRAWMLNGLDRALDLDMMAEHARTSVRTFTRRFREETGLSPARWLIAQRVERARHLLETSDLSVDEVARRAGFGTAVSLRQHLHAAAGVSPLAYRNAFRTA